MNQIRLYVNDKGDSCLANWTVEELRRGYDTAEAEADDVFYMALMREFERRKLHVVDPDAEGHICGDRSEP